MLERISPTEEPYITIFETVVLGLSWVAISRYVEDRGGFSWARTAGKGYSWFIAAISTTIIYFVATIPPTSETATLRHLFHNAKLLECFGLMIAAAGGKSDAANSGHSVYYRMTMPYLSLVRMLHNSEGWRTFATLNAAHHLLLYVSSGTAAGVVPQPLLDLTGFLQLAGGIAAEAYVLMQREGDILPHAFTAALLGSYMVLWAREIGMRHEDEDLGKPKAKRIRYWGLASDI